MTFLKFLMLLALIVWIGGIIFFAFVVAPSLFAVVPTPDLAGRVVSRSLHALHWMGLISGAVFLLSSLSYNQGKHANPRLFSPVHWLIAAMLVLTAISQFGVMPAIRRSRAVLVLGNISAGELTQRERDTRLKFDRLHAWSVRLEGGVLILGLVSVALTARHFGD
jgi:uncharacterized membrane protein